MEPSADATHHAKGCRWGLSSSAPRSSNISNCNVQLPGRRAKIRWSLLVSLAKRAQRSTSTRKRNLPSHRKCACCACQVCDSPAERAISLIWELKLTFALISCCYWAAGGTALDNPLVLILVVEDDFLIQELVDTALVEGGFQTDLIASGEEAVARLQGDAPKYRALVTDINLSDKLTGWDVAKRAREIDPEIPVVYMTGAGANDWPSSGVPKSVLLNKPFAPAQVVTAISQLLNQSSPTQE